jgi:diaminopimelate decarboxylase
MKSATLRDLLPASARATRDRLVVGGIAAADLVDRFGSPLLVYDEQELRARCATVRAAFPDGASYAAKAFLCGSIARLVHEEGLGLDVASDGELAVARAAGVPAAALTLHGNNKSLEELDSALSAEVGRTVLDSLDEVHRLEALAAACPSPPRVAVRVNPDVTAATHRSIQTGQADSKFGTALGFCDAEAIIRRLRSSPLVSFCGLHVHIGSQITDLDALGRAILRTAALASRVEAAELIVGGGLGVAYRVGDVVPDIPAWGAIAHGTARRAGFAGRILAEPGRAVSATAGITLYTIGTVKSASSTTFLAVDGGLSENPRPALYQARYQPFLARCPQVDARPGPYTVVGKNCEASDTFARDVAIPGDPRVGDLLCVPVTGAYCYSMASNYNRLPRPAVVMVSDGHSYPILRRETIADLLRLDLVA